MDIPLKNNRLNRCKICNKDYSSYKSLWNHNNKFHSTIEIKKDHLEIKKDHLEINLGSLNDPNTLNCKYCNKKFSFLTNKYRHQQKCKNIYIVKQQSIENEINTIKELFAELLNKKGKIHHKTLEKFNKQVNNITNSNNITNNTTNINNGNIINNTFVKFGNLDYEKIFTDKEIKSILNKQFLALEESIKKVHFNKELPEYSNIFITNLQNNIGYIFNGEQFIAINKKTMLNELIDMHVNEINLSIEKLEGKINSKIIDKIEQFIEMINDDLTKFTDENNNKIYDNYKAYKVDNVKLLLYNNSDIKLLNTLNNIKLAEIEDDNKL